MARKVLLSFLGTGNYEECAYSLLNRQSSKTKYIQHALSELIVDDWTDEDAFIVLLTSESKEKHWNQSDKGSGLKELISAQDSSSNSAKLMPVDIRFSSDEEGIWDLFTTIHKQFQTNDEVYVDITHGFRFLPMLLMTVLNYEKVVHNIAVKKIFYGAFEMKVDGVAPIIDLTNLSLIQDWSVAAQNYVNYGVVDSMSKLIIPVVNERQQAASGGDEAAKVQRGFIKKLEEVTLNILSNRGTVLVNMEPNNPLSALDQYIGHFSDSNNQLGVLQPFVPLINLINEKLVSLTRASSSYERWMHAVDWCEKHDYIQQGITQLQEGVITFICQQFSRVLDYENVSDREIVTGVINFVAIPDENQRRMWRWSIPEKSTLTVQVKEFVQNLNIASSYGSLTQLRNDINHGGYKSESKKGKEIVKAFRKNFNEIKSRLDQFLQRAGQIS